jgi:hypothetical protein
MISPAGLLDPCGKGEGARWLLRGKLAQFPALPDRTWPFTRPGPSTEEMGNEEPETGGDGVKLPSTSDPAYE